ncbi:DUF460 domain-containing protein [Methanohalophilus sp.]
MTSNTIYGIDVARGSPRSGQVPRYAVAILKRGSVYRHSMLKMHRIFRMIKDDHPMIIAVDNIYELAKDKKELIHFLEKLPSDVKLVQVTGGLKKVSLPFLAHKYDISINPRDPGDEAEACAKLAEMGAGVEVSLFEDKTKIKVSRARSLGRGGWSQNRYRRKVHGAVKVKCREIESILKGAAKERNFNYTSKVIKGFGGYVRCEFTVNARKCDIPIHSSSGSDVQVNVRSLVRDKIQYIPLKSKERRPTIVGVDPGTTVGLSILSLEGDVLHCTSYRGISHDEMVKLISEYGKPAIVATDVYPMPVAVEKIRRSFSAVSYSPGGPIPSEEKIEMAKPHGYSNDHERDSLSAAISAYKKYRQLFLKIESKSPPYMDIDNIKVEVINGSSIEEAINSLKENKQTTKAQKSAAETSGSFSDDIDDETCRKMTEKLKRRDLEIAELQEYVKELIDQRRSRDSTISNLESKIRQMRETERIKLQKEKEISIRNKKIANLKKDIKRLNKRLHDSRAQVNRLKRIKKMESRGEGIPVKVISSFSREAILNVADVYGLKKGDVVYFQDPSGGNASTAGLLADYSPKALIVPAEISYAAKEVFFEKSIPVLQDLEIQKEGDFAVVSPKTLKIAIENWFGKADHWKKEKEEEKLKSLVDEYRSERRRGIT